MIEDMGGVGAVFHACCLLETTKTFVSPIRTLPISPYSVYSSCPSSPSPLAGAIT
jgi:hypothetical protein